MQRILSVITSASALSTSVRRVPYGNIWELPEQYILQVVSMLYLSAIQYVSYQSTG